MMSLTCPYGVCVDACKYERPPMETMGKASDDEIRVVVVRTDGVALHSCMRARGKP